MANTRVHLILAQGTLAALSNKLSSLAESESNGNSQEKNSLINDPNYQGGSPELKRIKQAFNVLLKDIKTNANRLGVPAWPPALTNLPGTVRLVGSAPIAAGTGQVAEVDPDGDCSICLEPKSTGVLYVGKCGHSIHATDYIKLPNPKRCPLCRNTPYGGRKSRKHRRRH
jgi:hypothetical protein